MTYNYIRFGNSGPENTKIKAGCIPEGIFGRRLNFSGIPCICIGLLLWLFLYGIIVFLIPENLIFLE